MNPTTTRWALAALVCPALLASCGDTTKDKASPTTVAPAPKAAGPESQATLRSADGGQVGVISFSAASGGTEVKVELASAQAVTAARFHGIHVHANDDPANGDGCKADPVMASSTWFTSADGHLKSGAGTHGDHVGDLSSVLVKKDGTATLSFTTDRFTPAEVVGRAVIIHAGTDNYGNIPTGTMPDQYTANSDAATTKTASTGNAGDRMACGVISRA